MKKVFIYLAIALISVGCASKKKAAEQKGFEGDVEVIVPCTGKDYQTNKDAFRASGYGYSNDMNIAKSKALQNARAELATSLSATVKRVTDNYSSSYQLGEQEEAKQRFQDLSRTVVNQEIVGSVVVCEKLMKTPSGQYRYYVCVELGSKDVVKALDNAVKADDKLRTDYEYEKFKSVFEEEMSKMK